MRDFWLMLAQAQHEVPKEVAQAPPEEIPPAFMNGLPVGKIWDFVVSVSWLQAIVFIAFGAIYLIYGWRVFKALVVINFAGLGLAAGYLAGGRLGSTLWGGIIGTFILAAVSWPFMKYSVAVLGALAGAVLGAALWRTVTLPDLLTWAGALVGLIAGGLLAFASFKSSIMFFSSLQGSMFVIIGALALLHDYPELGNHLTRAVYEHAFFLPSLVIIPTIVGIYFQQRLLKQENKWTMPT